MTAEAPAHTGNERLEVRSPADGRVVGMSMCGAPAGSYGPLVSCGKLSLRGRISAPGGRVRHLRDWLDWIMDNERRTLDLVQAESGKSWGDTAFETSVAVNVVDCIGKNLASWLADRKVSTVSLPNMTKRLRVHLRPHQLVGIITPWNIPFGIPMADVPFALAAGAAVLSKPSEITPLAWAETVRGWNEEIGAPPVLACATGAGATGAAVVDAVDMVQFTGSTRTGPFVSETIEPKHEPHWYPYRPLKSRLMARAIRLLACAIGAAAWAAAGELTPARRPGRFRRAHGGPRGPRAGTAHGEREPA